MQMEAFAGEAPAPHEAVAIRARQSASQRRRTRVSDPHGLRPTRTGIMPPVWRQNAISARNEYESDFDYWRVDHWRIHDLNWRRLGASAQARVTCRTAGQGTCRH